MVHPTARFVVPKQRLTRTVLVLMIVILIAASGIVGYLIYSQAFRGNLGPNIGLLNTPIPTSLYDNLSGVSYSTLASIGTNQSGISAPTAAPSGTSVSQLIGPNGKPEVLYIGGEWCPFCAAERWSLVIALSKFGNFSGLTYMESSSSDVYPNTNTFSFYDTTYTSQYISFVAIEHEDRNHNTLRAPTNQQLSLWGEYTTGADSIPFVYIDGQYYLTGAQYSPGSLSNLNWTQIASQLNNPQSSVAKLIDGSANELIGAICTTLKSKAWPTPASLCNQSFANVSLVDTYYNSTSVGFYMQSAEQKREVFTWFESLRTY